MFRIPDPRILAAEGRKTAGSKDGRPVLPGKRRENSPMSCRSFCIDLHVHTSRHSFCAEFLNPEDIGRYCRSAGIHGVVLTEHDTSWVPDELASLQSRFEDIRLFNGIEVTTEEDCHLVMFGLEDSSGLLKGIPCGKAIDYAHEQNGAVILAHPFRRRLPPLWICKSVDAVEVGSLSSTLQESMLARHLAKILDKPSVASSDAHTLSMIGWGHTELPNKPLDDRELVEMIRWGMGSPVLPNAFPG